MVLIQAIVVLGFVAVHVWAGKLRFLDGIPRSRWLSIAGGISVAYVFIHVFPELNEAQQRIGAGWTILPFIEQHAYVVALLGLVLFYGLERVVQAAQQRGGAAEHSEGETRAGIGIFWVHTLSFAVYNALIGYLLVHREEQDERGLLLFSVAMGLHFLVNDYGLRQAHQATYRRVGRWVLATAIVFGWGVGVVSQVGMATISVLFAFLAGGVVLNVLKEELPQERESRFGSFAGGVVVYTLLLLLL